MPDESTVRKLTRRIGAETVSELTRALIVKATREKRFRPRAVRIDSTVIEADVKYPTDAGLASAGVRTLAPGGSQAGEADRGEEACGCGIARGRWGASCGRSARTIRRRSGEAKEEVLKLTKETGELLERSVREARRLAALARRRARGRGAKAKLKAAAAMEEMADRCEKVARQIRQRVADEPIKDRIVSLFDPDARPIRKGKLGKPTEFGFVSQLAEVTENTKPGARGLILPASTAPGQPAENDDVARLPSPSSQRLGIIPAGGRARRRVPARADEHRARGPGTQDSVHRWPPGTRPPDTPSAGCGATEPGEEGRISHLKRRYGLDRIPPEGRRGPADLD